MPKPRRSRRIRKSQIRAVRVTTSLADIAAEVASLHPVAGGARGMLISMSGIDGSGKTHLSKLLAHAIEEAGLRVALIGIDPWQNPQTVRFGGANPGTHFYQYAIRFDELFSRLVDPLVAERRIHLAVKGIRTDRDVWDELRYDFEGIDVVLLEGILLFQSRFVGRYDLRIWVECSFETAVRRALERNVEDLPVERLLDDYDTIYHAAQRHHFSVDDPKAHADIFLMNDQTHPAGPDEPRPGPSSSPAAEGICGGCLKGLILRQ